MIKTPVWNIGGGIRHGQNLINYFTDENNKTRNMIIDEINHKLNNMKKLIGEENEK